MNKNISWNELKIVNGVWGYSEDNKEYSVFKTDGNRTYTISFDKEEYNAEGTDCKDFYDNYKTDIDENKYPVEIRRANDNKQTLQVSSREIGMFLFWTSCFDKTTATTAIGEGDRLLLELNDTDTEKAIEGKFLQDVFIEDGVVYFENAPLGANISFAVVCPMGAYYYKHFDTGKPCSHDNSKATIAQATSEIILAEFVKNVLLFGTNTQGITFDSSDFSKISQYYNIKITVKNGDTKANFKVWAMLKGCREILTND
ncbi:MAG: hypothetical protein GY817_01225 [bacterium]|nr:hypothetical protein [bacterium]